MKKTTKQIEKLADELLWKLNELKTTADELEDASYENEETRQDVRYLALVTYVNHSLRDLRIDAIDMAREAGFISYGIA